MEMNRNIKSNGDDNDDLSFFLWQEEEEEKAGAMIKSRPLSRQMFSVPTTSKFDLFFLLFLFVYFLLTLSHNKQLQHHRVFDQCTNH